MAPPFDKYFSKDLVHTMRNIFIEDSEKINEDFFGLTIGSLIQLLYSPLTWGTMMFIFNELSCGKQLGKNNKELFYYLLNCSSELSNVLFLSVESQICMRKITGLSWKYKIKKAYRNPYVRAGIYSLLSLTSGYLFGMSGYALSAPSLALSLWNQFGPKEKFGVTSKESYLIDGSRKICFDNVMLTELKIKKDAFPYYCIYENKNDIITFSGEQLIFYEFILVIQSNYISECRKGYLSSFYGRINEVYRQCMERDSYENDLRIELNEMSMIEYKSVEQLLLYLVGYEIRKPRINDTAMLWLSKCKPIVNEMSDAANFYATNKINNIKASYRNDRKLFNNEYELNEPDDFESVFYYLMKYFL